MSAGTPQDESFLDEDDQRVLLDIARHAVERWVRDRQHIEWTAFELTEAVRGIGGSFVTVRTYGQLRGCIGSLEARRPLAVDVCENAYAAAFRAPRFAVLTAPELDKLDLSISVLTPSRAMQFESEQDLIRQLRPGVDGLILTDAGRRGTFLPSVWEQLPEATDFLRHLKLKAGLPADHWSDGLRVERYTTISW